MTDSAEGAVTSTIDLCGKDPAPKGPAVKNLASSNAALKEPTNKGATGKESRRPR
jgi:hypothetical protein